MPPIDVDVVPLLVAYLLDHHHHSFVLRPRRTSSLPSSISPSPPVKCLCHPKHPRYPCHRPPPPLPCRHNLYSFLSIEVYRSIIGSKKSLIVALVDLLSASGTSTRSIKDALKALFSLDLYPLNRTTLVELSVVLPLFALVVKDGRKGVVEDMTIVIAQVTRCDKSIEAFQEWTMLVFWWIWWLRGARGQGKMLRLCYRT